MRRLTGWASFGLVVLGVLTGLATFMVLTGMTEVKQTPQSTTLLLIANGALLLVMALSVLGQVIFL
ncbi:MAG: hypothetical protein ACREDN_05955, partial [Aestuariivirga sp.]